jgi:PadR family transcriptional regulator PadR
MTPDLDLLRGTLDLLILKTLTWGPRHGYAVTEWVRQITGDELVIEDGALYQSLHRLEARGLVAAAWGLSDNNRKAKFYRLTPAGRRRLASHAARWERYAAAVGRVLRAVEG